MNTRWFNANSLALLRTTIDIFIVLLFSPDIRLDELCDDMKKTFMVSPAITWLDYYFKWRKTVFIMFDGYDMDFNYIFIPMERIGKGRGISGT